MALIRRVEVLFDPEKFTQLETIAQARSTTVSGLIREVVERELIVPTLEARLDAVEWLASQSIDLGAWEEIKQGLIRAEAETIEAP